MTETVGCTHPNLLCRGVVPLDGGFRMLCEECGQDVAVTAQDLSLRPVTYLYTLDGSDYLETVRRRHASQAEEP